jgi:hypothetical protein
VFTVATRIAARLLLHRRKGLALLALSLAAAVAGCAHGGHLGLGFFDGPLH